MLYFSSWVNRFTKREGIFVPRFKVNVAGRIRNFSLPKNQPLIPLFEAVVNSIHAIEERMEKDSSFTRGEIMINVIRDTILPTIPLSYAPIQSFSIIDNGIGFNERNFESFLEADSDYKKEKGGKGVGRFSWLKAFSKVYVESIYGEFPDCKVWNKRSFDFLPNNEDIDDVLDEVSGETAEFKTTVLLKDYYSEYKSNAPKQLSTVAHRILQHCLVYFVSPTCPVITIKDDEEEICLNKLFSEAYAVEQHSENVTVSNHAFTLLHMKVSNISAGGNRLYLCANNRLVEDIDLEKYIVDLDKQLFEKFQICYIGVLAGKYLDDNVDMNRLSFSIPMTGEDFLGMSIERIIESSCDSIETYLEQYLKPIQDEKNMRIEKYVVDHAPQFRHLLRYMSRDISRIKPNLSDDRLDDELHSLKRRFDRTVREENARLLEDFKQETISEEEYKTRFEEQVRRISDANKSVLADYVDHRRIILDLLEKYLQSNNEGKYDTESCIHQLIYPMRATAEEIEYEAHNLWLIDERLAYSQ